MGEVDVSPKAAALPSAGLAATNGHGPGLSLGRAAPVPYRVPTRIRWFLGIASALVVAFIISLIVRPVGSYVPLIDGWGIYLLEVAVGLVCLGRYFERTWHGSDPIGRTFPLALGAASMSWGIGDLVLTGMGGPNVTAPSAADIFYIGFFLLCFTALALLIRRGNRSSLTATALDGLIAGLAVAAVAAAFVVSEVIRVSGDGRLTAVTQLVYPLGDVLLLALCIGGFAVLPSGYRRFFGLAGVALGGQRSRRRVQPPAAQQPLRLHRERGSVAGLADAPGHRGLGAPRRHRGTTGRPRARLHAAVHRRADRTDRAVPVQRRAHRPARRWPGHRNAPRRRRAPGAQRPGGPRAEVGPLHLSHRQDVGPDRGGRGRPACGVHHPVIGTRPWLPSRGPGGEEHSPTSSIRTTLRSSSSR